MEQRLDGTHPRVGVEMALDRIAMEEIVQREEAHALMMGQVRSARSLHARPHGSVDG